MEDEKTLLQQIREMEQEFTKKIEIVRAETEAAVAAARSEAEDMLCTCGQCRENCCGAAVLEREREGRD